MAVAVVGGGGNSFLIVVNGENVKCPVRLVAAVSEVQEDTALREK